MAHILGALLFSLLVIQFAAIDAADFPCHNLTALDDKGETQYFNLDALAPPQSYRVNDSSISNNEYEFMICHNFQCAGVDSATGACLRAPMIGNFPLGAYPSPIVTNYTTEGYPKGALVLPLGVQDNQGAQRTATITIICDPEASYVQTDALPLPPTALFAELYPIRAPFKYFHCLVVI
jgi:hypothetical protein